MASPIVLRARKLEQASTTVDFEAVSLGDDPEAADDRGLAERAADPGSGTR